MQKALSRFLAFILIVFIAGVNAQQPWRKQSSSSVKVTSSASVVPENPNKNPGKEDPNKQDPGARQPSDQQPGGQVSTGSKVIAFMTPWSNTSAILFVNGDSTGLMTTLKGHCGWFKITVKVPAEGLKVHFKQTIGMNYVSAHGMIDMDPGTADDIDLSEYLSADTIWVKGVKNGATAVSSEFPRVLGDCPLKKFPVTVFDWLHGTKGDMTTSRDGSVNWGNADPSFGTSADFGSGGCGGSNARDENGKGYMKGMVEYNLGRNGVPVPATPFPENCLATDHLAYWFLPESLAVDKKGKTLTNMVCRDIYVSMDDEGFWLGEVSSSKISEGNEKNKGGMFLVDDFKYLDEDETIPNPYYDQLNGSGGIHNFGFAVKIQAQFEYVPGQYFDFYGDDDVWVFIDRRLAVDIGGQHGQVAGAVLLDTIGQNTNKPLIPGQTYDFHIFYVERHTSSSNFRMRTSIDLRTEASLILKDLSSANTMKYEIWALIKETALSCGISSDDMATKDTSLAPSNFVLTGGNLPSSGVVLDTTGVWYNGITIDKGFTGFSIDTAAIKTGRTLSPGVYCLRFSLQADASQADEVWFVVNAYDLPSIAYANDKYEIIGTNVDAATTPLGEWAYQVYPVYIRYKEDYANYNDVIYISSTDPNLAILDADNNPISSVMLDSGKAMFYVKGLDEVNNAAIMVKGAATANTARYYNINMKLPPVPVVKYAIITDRNGDGIGDSIYVKYDKTLKDRSTLDTVQFTFGENLGSYTKYNLLDEYTITLTKNEGFGVSVFTGRAKPYTGVVRSKFTYIADNKEKVSYTLDGDLSDGVNPIISSANIELTNNGTELVLKFSEGLADSSKAYYENMFQFLCLRAGTLEEPIKPQTVTAISADEWRLLYLGNATSVVPAVGDSIKFLPKRDSAGVTHSEVAYDLAENPAHTNNPWVRITGQQDLKLSSPSVVTLGETTEAQEIIKSKDATVPTLITNPAQTAQQVADSLGVQGQMIGFDMSELASNQTAESIAQIDAMMKTLLSDTTNSFSSTNSDGTPTAGTIAQIFNAIQSGEISVKKLKKMGLEQDAIDAIKEGKINASNLAEYRSGEKTLISKDDIVLVYKTSYFTSLGDYVGGSSGEVKCTDQVLYGGNCMEGNGSIFLAWNMRSKQGRLVGTGVYIARLEVKVKAGKKVVVDQTRDLLWGVRRGGKNALDLGL